MAKVIASANDLRGASKLVIFGGSFDPPHQAHVALPRHVRAKINADGLVYVPAARSPHKSEQMPSAAAHRLAMLEAALADLDDTVILTDELDRASNDEPSYTVDTLQRMREALGESTSLCLLIGADQAPVFDKWHQADRIAQLAEVVVMLRPPMTREAVLGSLPVGERKIWQDRIVDVPAMDVSATTVRQRLARGESIDDLVPTAVKRYIEAHGLYRKQ